jgi:acyl dehydratase
VTNHLEDYEVGQTFGSATARIEAERMTSFAVEFDPQPFHLSDQGARNTIFGALAASGWYTAAITMKLLVDGELKPAGGVVGLGFDEIRWPKPVRPGDELSVRSEILEVRPSKSRSDQGLIKVRTTTTNQAGDAVQITVGNLLVRRRGIPA